MKARKVLVFVSLIIALVFFTVKIAQAFFIDNSDIPVNYECIGHEGFADAFLIGEKEPVGWNPATQWWGDPNRCKIGKMRLAHCIEVCKTYLKLNLTNLTFLAKLRLEVLNELNNKNYV